MKITVFASGSGGNCALVSDGSTHLLLDAGISMRRIRTALAHAGVSIDELDGVLITHEHADHIAGLKMLLKYHAPTIFAPHTVAGRLGGILPEAIDRMRVIDVGRSYEISTLSVRAFHTPHDTDESVGYRIEGAGGSFALATDMGCVTDEVLDGLLGADAVLIESNHDLELLQNGPYPFALKRRILSERGHLSNTACAALAARLARTGTRAVILGHLSRENNRPALALAESARALEGTGAALCCAPELGFLQLDTEGEPCFLSN